MCSCSDSFRKHRETDLNRSTPFFSVVEVCVLEVSIVAMIHSGSVLFPYPPLILWHSMLLVSYPDCVHSLGMRLVHFMLDVNV